MTSVKGQRGQALGNCSKASPQQRGLDLGNTAHDTTPLCPRVEGRQLLVSGEHALWSRLQIVSSLVSVAAGASDLTLT